MASTANKVMHVCLCLPNALTNFPEQFQLLNLTQIGWRGARWVCLPNHFYGKVATSSTPTHTPSGSHKNFITNTLGYARSRYGSRRKLVWETGKLVKLKSKTWSMLTTNQPKTFQAITEWVRKHQQSPVTRSVALIQFVKISILSRK